MPDGETHYAYFKRGYLVAIPASVLLCLWDLKFGAGCLVGYTLHRYCDPDWDLMGSSASEGRLVNELPVLGHLIYGMSSAYGATFRRYHRRWITHFPGVSTAIRLVWVFFIPFVLLDGFGINFIGGGWQMFWLGLWFGMSCADSIHWYLDLRSND